MILWDNWGMSLPTGRMKMTIKVKKALLPVGGLGVRFLPATKAVPKEMFPIVDKPLIQFMVEEAKAAGIEQIIFITSRGKQAIETYFDRPDRLEKTLEKRGDQKRLDLLKENTFAPEEIFFVKQDEPMGLGHAIWYARHFIQDEPFAVLLPDDLILADVPCLKQMVDGYRGGNMVAVQEISEHQVSQYGVVETVSATNGRVTKMMEKPHQSETTSRLGIVGRYILEPAVFAYLDQKVKGMGNEIQLTDAIASQIEKSEVVAFKFNGHRFDCGDKVGFIEANVAYALENPELRDRVHHMVDSYRLVRKVA